MGFDFLIGYTERFWVDIQPFLLHRGYRLRPRYDPNWKPSWLQVGSDGQQMVSPLRVEDSLCAGGAMLDAIRIEDNQKVVFKKVKTAGDELPIALFLSCDKMMRSDPRNCAVPILDVILIPADDGHALLVMPHLFPFHLLPFRRLDEFYEMALQLLEGLEVMHEQNIAHRDACWGNLMMDHSKVVPKGTHFIEPLTHDGVSQNFEWNARWTARPVRYYIIDFGISSRCPSKEAKVLGNRAQDTTAPELSKTVPYDPFALDVYHLGNVLSQCLKGYDGLGAFKGLVEHMTATDPSKRPTAAEAVKLCKNVIATVEKSWMTKWVWRHTTEITTGLDFFEKLAVLTGAANPMN